jgi:MFS family permease
MIFLNYLDRQILSIVAPVLQQEIGLDPQHYAWVVDAFLLAYAAMYAGSGLLLDYGCCSRRGMVGGDEIRDRMVLARNPNLPWRRHQCEITKAAKKLRKVLIYFALILMEPLAQSECNLRV